MEPVNPKVKASTAGAIGGGTGSAVLVIWVMKHHFGYTDADFDPYFVAALAGALAGPSAFISGWFKKRGMVEQL